MDVGKEKGEEERKGRLIVLALALAEHIDEVTLPTRPSYAKWTLQTGRPLNLICTSEQLPAKPRPDGSAESLFATSTPVCLFTDRFPSRISFLSRTLTPVCRYISFWWNVTGSKHWVSLALHALEKRDRILTGSAILRDFTRWILYDVLKLNPALSNLIAFSFVPAKFCIPIFTILRIRSCYSWKLSFHSAMNFILSAILWTKIKFLPCSFYLIFSPNLTNLIR